ncbi:MAG: ABC transporter substrate-binding protein, partial [Oscillospiraceae bacterium]
MKKQAALILAAALLLTAAIGCDRAKETKELTKITVSEVARSVFYAPQYAALTQGFFKEEGLEVELVTGQGADKVMTAVIAGQADIGFSGPEAVIYVANEGKANHAVVFAQVTKRDGSFIVGRKAVEKFDWEMLRGKHILGGRKGGVPEMTLEYVLRKNGLEPGRDVEVDTSVQFALMAGAFTGGAGDYTTLFEPTASMVEGEGKGVVLCSVGEQSGEMPYTCYYALKDYMAAHGDRIQRFANAIYKGQRWVETHSAREVAEAIAPFFPDSNLELLEKVTQRH